MLTTFRAYNYENFYNGLPELCEISKISVTEIESEPIITFSHYTDTPTYNL